ADRAGNLRVRCLCRCGGPVRLFAWTSPQGGAHRCFGAVRRKAPRSQPVELRCPRPARRGGGAQSCRAVAPGGADAGRWPEGDVPSATRPVRTPPRAAPAFLRNTPLGRVALALHIRRRTPRICRYLGALLVRERFSPAWGAAHRLPPARCSPFCG